MKDNVMNEAIVGIDGIVADSENVREIDLERDFSPEKNEKIPESNNPNTDNEPSHKRLKSADEIDSPTRVKKLNKMD